MAYRQQNQPGSRQGNHRTWDDDSREDREQDRFASREERQEPRGTNWDRMRDLDEQGGNRGRYAGYGDFGQGDYGGQGEQSSYRGGGPRQGEARGSSGTSNYGRSTGDYGSGRSDRDQDNQRARQSTGGGTGFRGYGFGEGGWTEPHGEGQQYGSTHQYGGSQQYGGSSGYGAGQGMHRGKGPKGYQRSDERIREMLCERLHDDPEIDASEVSVQVQSGRITLEGTVESRRVKNAIEDIAEQIGVHDVQNNLRVQKPGSQTQGMQAQGTQSSGGEAGRSGGSTPSAGKSTFGADESEQTRQKRN